MKINWIYSFLAIGLIISALFFSFKLYGYYQVDSKLTSDKLFNSPIFSQKEPGSRTHGDNITNYVGLFRKKNLFKVLGGKPKTLPEDTVQPEINLEEEISKFELLGIVSAEGQSQAVIKNKKTGETFYCKNGQKVNDFLVKEVLSDKVIFKLGGELAELRL